MTTIHAFHEEGKPQKPDPSECCHSNGKMTGRGKGAQATGMTAALRGLLEKVDSRTWETFTRSG